VAEAKIELRMGATLIGGLQEQPRCLHLVLRHALALEVAVAEAALRIGSALRIGFSLADRLPE
jgi:hypothetical protein